MEYPDGNYSTNERIVVQPSLGSQEDTVKFMLRCQKATIKELKESLMGVEIGSDGKEHKLAGIEPALNAKGMSVVERLLKGVLSPNILLGVFNTDDILFNCRAIELELNETMCDSWVEWGLDPNGISMLREEIMTQVRASYSRAKEYNKENGAFGNTTQAITQQVQTREIISKEKKGFNIPFLGGRKNE